MPILPNNTDPLADYVSGGVQPPLTQDGLVYNKIYAQTGVIDTLQTTNRTGYADPNISITNSSNNTSTFNRMLDTEWFSSQQFGGTGSAPVVLTYNFSVTTYYNIIRFYLLNVPCFAELGYYDTSGNWNALPGQSTFVINGGSDIYTTTDWVPIEYDAPSTLSNTSISLRITRNVNVQQLVNGIPVNVAYSVGVRTLSVKLQVLQQSDVPTSVVSGTSNIVNQNNLGFVESYAFVNNPVTNIFSSNSSYWKCSPQPTGDSIVYFYACLNDVNPQTINRLYIDPLYSGCRFNIYSTTQSTSSGTVDPGTFTWTPVQRDFTLRKGLYEIPTVTATYLKFEFTKLNPEAYDLPVDTITRTINVFPAGVEEYYSNIENSIIDGNSVQYSYLGNNNNPQTITTTNLSSSTVFGLSANTIANTNSWPQLSALNNSQLGGNTTTVANNTNSYIMDPTISYKLVDSNGDYNGVAYNQFLQRRFPTTQTHNYTQITLQQSWHEAYFTGIHYMTAFYEQQFDDIRIMPNNLNYNGTSTSGFVSQGTNYVYFNPDDYATTQWYSTIDSFKSFNIGTLASDWNSFITDSQVLMNDLSVTNSNYRVNCFASGIGSFGSSTIIQITPNVSGSAYGLRSANYVTSSNQATYTDANFITTSNWSAASGSTITPTAVTLVSGTASGLSVSGSTNTAIYTFTLPNVAYSGSAVWPLAFGLPEVGVVGYGSYNPTTSGLSYYFYSGVQVSGTASGVPTTGSTISSYTRFYDTISGAVISGTVVSGNTATFVSGTGSNTGYVESANYSTAIPSNTIQFVVSGTTNYKLYQFGVFPSQTSTWLSPVDRKNMRVSGAARIFLPSTDSGTYRFSLYATNTVNNNVVELAYKQFVSGSIPLNTWFEVQIETFTGTNYSNFYMQVQQVNTNVTETFYISMLSPFYYPIRFEYTTVSGSNYPNNYQFITGPINNPEYFVSTISGTPASGIQLRMTALDPNIFISGVSVVPYYKGSPYYAELDVNYIGNSKTNELSVRRVVDNKPYFQNTTNIYPLRFDVQTVVGPTTNYVVG